MTLPTKQFKNPETVLERKQESKHCNDCQSCIHHLYLWRAEVCQQHEGLVGENLARCADFKLKTLPVVGMLNEIFQK